MLKDNKLVIEYLLYLRYGREQKNLVGLLENRHVWWKGKASKDKNGQHFEVLVKISV